MADMDKVHGYCLDCGKKFSDKWMYSNPFAQEGTAPACNTCGGVVAVMDERVADSEIAKQQRARGIGREARATTHDWNEAEEKYVPQKLTDEEK